MSNAEYLILIISKLNQKEIPHLSTITDDGWSEWTFSEHKNNRGRIVVVDFSRDFSIVNAKLYLNKYNDDLIEMKNTTMKKVYEFLCQ